MSMVVIDIYDDNDEQSCISFVVYYDSFCLEIVVETLLSELSTDSRIFESSKRSSRGEFVVAVHVYCTNFKSIWYIIGFTQILGNNSCSKSVAAFVGSCDNFINIVKFENTLNWTKYFFLSNQIVIFNICEDSGSDIPSFASPSSCIGDKFWWFLSIFNVAKNFVHLLFADKRSLISIWIKRVSELDGFDLFDASLDKSIIYRGMNVGSWSSDAALPGVKEERHSSLCDCSLEVGMFGDDVGWFSSKFECDSLEVFFMTVSHDVITNLGWSCEGNFVNSWMSSKVSTNVSLSWNNVDNSVRDTSLFD